MKNNEPNEAVQSLLIKPKNGESKAEFKNRLKKLVLQESN